MIFPVITHWQMPCSVFFMITTAREKLANPWSNTCQNTLQSWHKLDLVPNGSTMGYGKGYSLSGFSLPPLLIVTCENSSKTSSILKSIYKPAKGAVWFVCQLKKPEVTLVLMLILNMTMRFRSLKRAGGEELQKYLGSNTQDLKGTEGDTWGSEWDLWR